MKLSKTSWAVWQGGHSKFYRSVGQLRAKQGKILQPVVLPNLQGKGLVRKEAYLLT